MSYRETVFFFVGKTDLKITSHRCLGVDRHKASEKFVLQFPKSSLQRSCPPSTATCSPTGKPSTVGPCTSGKLVVCLITSPLDTGGNWDRRGNLFTPTEDCKTTYPTDSSILYRSKGRSSCILHCLSTRS